MATDDRDRVDLERLHCRRCDHRGFVWRNASGLEVLPEDPTGTTAARCRHPATHRLDGSAVPDADRLDQLTADELEAFSHV